MNSKKLIQIFLWGVVFLSIGTLFFLHYSTKERYAYVDAQKLLNGYKGMQDARKEYEVQVMLLRPNLDTLRSEMEQKVKDYEARKSSIALRELRLMEEVIDMKHDQYVNFEQVVNEKIRGADQELTAKVLTKVNDYIKRYGESRDYNIIMAATQYGNIVYAEDHIDITEEILYGLNNEYGK